MNNLINHSLIIQNNKYKYKNNNVIKINNK